MRERPSSRLLILDHEESYEVAACREMLEETGLRLDDPGPQVARRIATFQLPTGEFISADERFFIIRIGALRISNERWTDLEREVMTEHRWWSADDLRLVGEQVWPEDLAKILIDCGAWPSVG